jgi:hypothetical protein
VLVEYLESSVEQRKQAEAAYVMIATAQPAFRFQFHHSPDVTHQFRVAHATALALNVDLASRFVEGLLMDVKRHCKWL